jgi:5-methylcytosine-specific restriction endonuclease McrA
MSIGHQWNTCWYCGLVMSRRNITFDHVAPKHYGGELLVTSCSRCNNLKADFSLDDFRHIFSDGFRISKFYGEKRGWKPW